MPLSETGRVLEGLESLATTVDDGELGDNLLELSSNSGVNTKTLSSTVDDEVLVGNVQAHEDARQYMTRPVPYYKDLCGICRELGSDGRDSVSDHNLDQQDNIPEVKFARPLNNFQYPVESVSSEEVKIKLVMYRSHRMRVLRTSAI
ncbi:hypothetical protein TEA_020143 [Camellia sinensis var. sinensis]|uniref:Uncharacterized protein n=1 Tax=Camellia sinensis var. sinensis TaxID=542762 RepID=A0A4S4DH59_CAMSN|nr:hypothetical protein TEA_020143 [Camellia sinensis var. sinensis]